MKNGTRFGVPILISAALLAGCETASRVNYSVIESSAPDESLSTDGFVYALQMKRLIIDKDDKGKLTLKLVDLARPDFRLRLSAESGAISQTKLQITYKPNTDIPLQLGSVAKNNLLDTIKDIGAIAGSIVAATGTAARGGSNVELPIVLDLNVEQFQTARSNPSSAKDPRAELVIAPRDLGVTIKLAPISPAAVSWDRAKPLIHNRQLDGYIYSACREADVEIVYGGVKTRFDKVSIDDPTFVQIIKLPTKGNLKMHPQCGVDVTDEGADDVRPTLVLRTIIEEVEKVDKKIKEPKK